MSFLEVKGLAKSYAKTHVFSDINLTIREGELVTLLGPSGCGKSTLLRCIAGLTDLDQGSICVLGQDITTLVPQKRGIGMVFQSYALFPNLSVLGNIAFGLKMQGVPVDEAAQRVAEVLDLVELKGQENKPVQQLSGGQRQRVALARALVVRPRILLLDEPLSALDARIRKNLQEEIRRIQLQLKLTTIFVTHDQEEAMLLSDRIFLIQNGHIVQTGSAESVYTRPASSFVAGFMGSYNLLDVAQSRALLGLEIKRQLAIRPESIYLYRPGQSGLPELGPHYPATVKHHQLLGNVIRYHLEMQTDLPHGQPSSHRSHISVMVDELNRSSAHLLPPGAPVSLQFNRQELQEVQ